MSNKIVPEFDEYGVAEDVLAELQHKWESKVIASHVAEFEVHAPQPTAPPAHMPQQHHHPYQAHPIHIMQPHYPPPHAGYPMQATAPGVKAEPVDSRFMLAGVQYVAPPLPGPAINGTRPAPPHPGGQTGVISFSRPPAPVPVAQQAARPFTPQTMSAQPQQSAPAAAQPASQQQNRIPQADGPSESSGDEDTPSPPPSQSFAPRPSHPSLPQPSASTSRAATQDDSEAINSDLDDSDTGDEEEAEEGGAGETDIVFCTYDKVARVKNKWKCVLKDGMIHVNGRDYLFAKCTGEFEW
ncbi:hypothetical protein BDN72DRAFT_870238 [Pluteus cervinus]|uniref:Uncharacterized protein n=1 Tax=Pluteus cervinus TaxID=181527 RepID=A0ACD3AY64_9AGAR|nr:hypothetical protein BDN72DRAFT_870238 [Pluteus cervinus]